MAIAREKAVTFTPRDARIGFDIGVADDGDGIKFSVFVADKGYGVANFTFEKAEALARHLLELSERYDPKRPKDGRLNFQPRDDGIFIQGAALFTYAEAEQLSVDLRECVAGNKQQ